MESRACARSAKAERSSLETDVETDGRLGDLPNERDSQLEPAGAPGPWRALCVAGQGHHCSSSWAEIARFETPGTHWSSIQAPEVQSQGTRFTAHPPRADNAQVHSIMRHAAETTLTDLEAMYAGIAWPLYKVYGHAFDAFKVMVQDPEAVFAKLTEVQAALSLKLSSMRLSGASAGTSHTQVAHETVQICGCIVTSMEKLFSFTPSRSILYTLPYRCMSHVLYHEIIYCKVNKLYMFLHALPPFPFSMV